MATNEELLVKKPNQAGQYTNLAGISDASKNNLNYYGQGYQESENVTNARNYLQSVIDKQPGDFASQYEGDIANLYQQIMGRGKFQYDVSKDPLYQQYKNQYVRQGQQAMQDTVGNAAALTGGYGNSWAAMAGSQAYQQYLQQLNDKVPEMYAQAWDRYNQEGDALRTNLGIASGLRDTEYGQWRDLVGDWQADRAFAESRYGDEYQRDYNAWMQMLSFWQNQAQAENQSYWNQQDYDFKVRQYNDAQAAAAAKKSGGSSYTPKPKKDPEPANDQKTLTMYGGDMVDGNGKVIGSVVAQPTADAAAHAVLMNWASAPTAARQLGMTSAPKKTTTTTNKAFNAIIK